MYTDITTISLPLPVRMGTVNCYLVATSGGFVLVDTGGSNNRQALLGELERAACRPGLLKIILLTHGDFDHSGNAAYLRTNFGGQIAMHPGDAGMIARGDMFVNRHKPNFLIQMLAPLFFGLASSDRFTPDLLLADGDDLTSYGLDAHVIAIPGHSRGSIAILTARNDLFCGDLLVNTDKPALNSLIDDSAAAYASLLKLESLHPGTVYPGHGKPFSFQLVMQAGD